MLIIIQLVKSLLLKNVHSNYILILSIRNYRAFFHFSAILLACVLKMLYSCWLMKFAVQNNIHDLPV